MKRFTRAGALSPALLLTLVLAACQAPSAGAIDMSVRYSKFVPDAIEVLAGTTVTFTIRNDDPIAHEFILGTAEEHAEHARGTDVSHDGAPGAASLGPGETKTVTYRFDRLGSIEFACHLPGHYAYGMRGIVTVW